MSKTPKMLYHYCSMENFMKIMQNGTIRFSDITKSNDSEELYFIIKLYKEFLHKKHSKSSNERTVTHAFDYFYKQDLKQEAAYVWCLSEKIDDLGQWRGYAPQGGVCLCFNAKELKKHFLKTTINLNDNDNPIRLCKIKYVSFDSIEDCQAKNAKRNLIKKYKAMDNNIPVNNLKTLCQLSVEYKNYGFVSEQEYRFYLFNFTIESNGSLPEVQFDKKTVNLGFDTCFIDGKQSIKTFYDFPFPYQALEGVIIGPKTTCSKEDLLCCLEQSAEHHNKNKLNNELPVLSTKLTYR